MAKKEAWEMEYKMTAVLHHFSLTVTHPLGQLCYLCCITMRNAPWLMKVNAEAFSANCCPFHLTTLFEEMENEPLIVAGKALASIILS
jgi:hypothetical protein